MYRQGVVREHATLLNAVLRVVDAAGVVLSAWIAHRLYLDEWIIRDGYPAVIGVAVLLTALIFPVFHLYRPWRGISYIEEMRVVTFAWSSVALGLLAFIFLIKQGPMFSRGWMLVWLALGWLSILALRLLLRVAMRMLRRKGFNLRHIVLVGSVAMAREISERLAAASWMGIKIRAFYKIDDDTAELGGDDVPTVTGLADIAELVQRESIDQVWIALPLKAEDAVKSVLHELRNTTVDIRYIPDMFGMRLLNHSVSEIAGFPVLELSVTPMAGMNRLLKALEDRVLACLILLLISPVMVILALGVKLTSPGPVFYRQERVGWNGRPFMMLKFRSMPVDVEQHGVQWGGGKEKTTTSFGAFIRRTSLDELPQFINVLKGDMSIVGPRPERTVFVEQFKDEVPGYMKKHLVKAGITGWAQVNGWRGDTDLNKRIEHDLYYIEHWSIWLDLKIIALTIFKGINNENAY
jgi:Undecaprenyl-phosphate glucose phosphotransferase